METEKTLEIQSVAMIASELNFLTCRIIFDKKYVDQNKMELAGKRGCCLDSEMLTHKHKTVGKSKAVHVKHLQ